MRFLGFGKRGKDEAAEPAPTRKRDLDDVVNRTLARLAEEGSKSTVPPPPPLPPQPPSAPQPPQAPESPAPPEPPASTYLVPKGGPDVPADQPVELRPDEPNVDAALEIIASAIGENPQFEMASIFPPELWADPVIAHELNLTKIRPNMVGNKMALLIDAELAARLRASPDSPLRAALLDAEFGLAPFDENKPNGFASGKTKFLHDELRKIAASGASKEAREMSVYALHEWTARLMRGEIDVQFPGM
jgi:hypothetical protein